eukprot:m.293033 g.293033  ORF g.293033 m.293033 type:complete len:998 (+) comp18099_c0_seq1:33-3026(+)
MACGNDEEALRRLKQLSKQAGMTEMDFLNGQASTMGLLDDDDGTDDDDEEDGETESASCQHAVCEDPYFSKHVPRHIVKKLISTLCSKNHCAVHIAVRDEEQIFACLHGHVQSGKTQSLTMIALVLFLKYNLGTLMLLLNNASTYSSFEESVNDFNKRLVMEYGLSVPEAKRVSVQLATLRSSRAGLTKEQLKPDAPAVYGRLLRAANVRPHIKAGLAYIEKAGVNKDGYINAVLVLDEAHATTSQNGDTHQLERAIRVDDLSSLRPQMREHMMKWFTLEDGSADLQKIDSILEKVDARGWQADKLFRGVIYVTATVLPIALTESNRVIQLLQAIMPIDYFGYDDTVPPERRIELVVEPATQKDTTLPKLIANTAWVMNRLDHAMASDTPTEHVVLYASGRNAERFELATFLAHRYHSTPFVAICLVGTYGGFGAFMVFSESAKAVAQQIAAADKALHCNKEDLHISEVKPSPGERIMTNEGSLRRFRPPYGGHLLEAASVGKARLHLDAESHGGGNTYTTPTVHFVNSAHYRDRVLLDVVNKARELAGVSEGVLNIVSIGKRLLREGITLKTTDHKLAPSAMLYTGIVSDDVQLIQTRIAGRQRAATPPKLHASKDVIDQLRLAYDRGGTVQECMGQAFEAGEAPAVVARSEIDRSLASANFLSRNFNMPAMRDLASSGPVSEFHQLSAPEAQEQMSQTVMRVTSKKGWKITRKMQKVSRTVGACLPDSHSFCYREHEIIDEWAKCDECFALTQATKVKSMLQTTSPNLQERFYQAVTAIGLYMPLAKLSGAKTGWPLVPDDQEQPCWWDVAIGIGSTEKRAHMLIREVKAAQSSESLLVPLRWHASGWKVQKDWLRAVDVNEIPLTHTELLNCLSVSDSQKLSSYLAKSLQASDPQQHGAAQLVQGSGSSLPASLSAAGQHQHHQPTHLQQQRRAAGQHHHHQQHQPGQQQRHARNPVSAAALALLMPTGDETSQEQTAELSSLQQPSVKRAHLQ